MVQLLIYKVVTVHGNTSVDHNITDHTKITTTGTAPAVGFNVNLIGLFGRKLDGLGDGTHEVDINGTRVSQGSGIFFRSGLNGTYKIIARPSSTSFVVRKKDIHFTVSYRQESKWFFWSKMVDRTRGAGYNTNAKAYFWVVEIQLWLWQLQLFRVVL